MPRYQRAHVPGGRFFFTVAIADRTDDLLVREIGQLRRIYQSVAEQCPFETLAICILPDHLHAMWSLPDGDSDFAGRWNRIKSRFSRGFASPSQLSSRQLSKREKGLWQRRYWEHVIRDDRDFTRHLDYIHFNPVKHGLVSRVCDWPHSSFHQFVERGELPRDWGGDVREFTGSFGE